MFRCHRPSRLYRCRSEVDRFRWVRQTVLITIFNAIATPSPSVSLVVGLSLCLGPMNQLGFGLGHQESIIISIRVVGIGGSVTVARADFDTVTEAVVVSIRFTGLVCWITKSPSMSSN